MGSLWKRLSTPGKVALIASAVLVAGCAIATARRDLAGRDPHEVRGRKDVWERVTYFPGGAAAYLLAGRKRRAA